MQQTVKVIKIGGNVVDNPELLAAFCGDFARLDAPKVLVHGGGVIAGKIQKALGQEPVKIEGRRVTDRDTLKVVTMVYAGWCNKDITARLQAHGVNAIGLAGCDGSAIRACRRSPRTLSDGISVVDYGFVGDVTPNSVNVPFIRSLLSLGLVPVFCAINHDGRGQLLNTNADTIASSLAAALNAELFFCFEKNGVLYDLNDGNSVIPVISPAVCESLKAGGRISEGMLPKIENAFATLRSGASAVVIKHSSALQDADAGTRIILDE